MVPHKNTEEINITIFSCGFICYQSLPFSFMLLLRIHLLCFCLCGLFDDNRIAYYAGSKSFSDRFSLLYAQVLISLKSFSSNTNNCLPWIKRIVLASLITLQFLHTTTNFTHDRQHTACFCTAQSWMSDWSQEPTGCYVNILSDRTGFCSSRSLPTASLRSLVPCHHTHQTLL